MRLLTECLRKLKMQKKQSGNLSQICQSITSTGKAGSRERLTNIGRFGLLSIALLSLSPSSQADFKIMDEGGSVIEINRLRTNAVLDLKLDKKPAEALRAGIPLTLSINIQLFKHKGPLWKQRISSWSYQYILNYHRLSGRYLIENKTSGQMKTFATLIEALNSVSQVRSSERLPIPINEDDRMQVRLRAKLDTNELPTPLRLITIFFRDWQQISEWKKWEITR